MKKSKYLASSLAMSAVFVAACIYLGASEAKASVTYTVSINTSSLVSNVTAAPFALDFQFNGTAGNTATVGNFNYGGGSFTNSPAVATFGLASGSLSSGTLVLGGTSLSDAFNELYQGFTPGSFLSFDVTLGTTVNPTDAPDGFFFSILDNNLANIPTDGLGDSLVSITIDPSLTVIANSGTGAFSGVSASVVPEPSTSLLGGLGVIALLRRRNRA